LLYERPAYRIDNLCLGGALVQIANRRAEWIETLFQSAIEPFLHLLAEISAVVHGDDGLDIGREPSGNGLQIHVFGSKVNLDSGINQLTYVCPILLVPHAPIDLVDDDSLCLLESKQSQHLIECRSSGL